MKRLFLAPALVVTALLVAAIPGPCTFDSHDELDCSDGSACPDGGFCGGDGFCKPGGSTAPRFGDGGSDTGPKDAGGGVGCQQTGCPAGQDCDLGTGACLDRCAALNCAADHHCDPGTNTCIPNATSDTCTESDGTGCNAQHSCSLRFDPTNLTIPPTAECVLPATTTAGEKEACAPPTTSGAPNPCDAGLFCLPAGPGAPPRGVCVRFCDASCGAANGCARPYLNQTFGPRACLPSCTEGSVLACGDVLNACVVTGDCPAAQGKCVLAGCNSVDGCPQPCDPAAPPASCGSCSSVPVTSACETVNADMCN